jgi:hypothetical protein
VQSLKGTQALPRNSFSENGSMNIYWAWDFLLLFLILALMQIVNIRNSRAVRREFTQVKKLLAEIKDKLGT